MGQKTLTLAKNHLPNSALPPCMLVAVAGVGRKVVGGSGQVASKGSLPDIALMKTAASCLQWCNVDYSGDGKK